jgi:pimeloyl-ACP methyl ester carboxylesterase
VLIALVALAVVVMAAGWWLAGGRSTPLLSPPGLILSPASELPGVHCDRMVIPVRLSASGWFQYDVVGELCALGPPRGKTLQILVSGAGYGPVYWDFPYEPDTYSYARAALRAGYATFNFYRPGMGESDRPLGLLLNVDNQAYVLEQVVDTLRREHDFGKVVTIGHSFGSVTAIAHALAYPASVDGIVLTGFAHNTNPGFITAMRTGVDLAAIKGPFAGRIIDPTYLVSKPGTRHQTFYTAANADPAVIEVDEMNRQTTALGEVISAGKYFGPQSKALATNVLQVLGENDFVVCGGDLDCRDHARTIAHEQAFFPAAASYEMVILEHTGHDAALHRHAPATTALILDWIARRIDGLAVNREK